MPDNLQQVAQAAVFARQAAGVSTDESTTAIADLTARIEALEAFQTSATSELADHESRITALEP